MSFQKLIGQSLIWRGLYFVTVLVINVFLSRYLEAGGAGWVFYLSNNFSFIVILTGWTMEASVNYYAATKNIDDSRLAWFSVAWTLWTAITSSILIGLYLQIAKPPFASAAGDYFFYAICYVAGIQLTNFFSGLFYAESNFFLPNFLMVTLNLVLIAIIPKQPADNPDASFIIKIYFAFFVITGLALAVAYCCKKKSWKRISFPTRDHLRLLLRYGLLALSANIIFFLVYRVDYFFVERYCTAIELGNYIQVSRLGQMLLVIPTIISSAVFPHTAAGVAAPGEIKANLQQIGKITSVLYLALFLVVAIAGNWLFPFVFGQSFRPMYIPFLLILPGIWALSNLYILSAYFGGMNRVNVNVTGAAIALMVILAGDYLFIPRFGIAGAAAVSTVGYCVNFLYAYVAFRNQYRVVATRGKRGE